MKTPLHINRGWIYLLLLTNLSCETIVDVDLKEPDSKIVVNSFFSPDSVWQVRVTKSRFILSNKNDFDVDDKALVTIRDFNNNIVETLLPTVDQFNKIVYKGISKPELGKVYSIKVESTGNISVAATSKIPTATPIISAKIDPLENNRVQVSVLFSDNPKEKNFYLLKVLNEYGYDLFVDAVDPTYNNNTRGTPGILFNDNLFNGRTIDFRINADSPPIKKIVLVSISEEYYQYFVTKDLQQDARDDPFAQPVQLFNNIENGLGIFAGYNSSVLIL
jgi:hypothetical protein